VVKLNDYVRFKTDYGWPCYLVLAVHKQWVWLEGDDGPFTALISDVSLKPAFERQELECGA
jgi:hypothetical protein